MTCIAVCKGRDGKCMMASERMLGIGDSFSQYMTKSKITKRDGILIGAAGSGNLCTLFVDVMPIPKITAHMNTDVYMYRMFYTAIEKELVVAGYVDSMGSLNLPMNNSCSILVCVHNRIYTVDISNPEEGYGKTGGLIVIDEVSAPFAIGSGYMLSIMSLMKDQKAFKYLKREHLEDSIMWACKLSPFCGMPDDMKPDFIKED